MRAAAGLDADGAAVLDDEAGDLAVLDDVDAVPVGSVGKPPGDGIVAGGAGAALEDAAMHREAGVGRKIEIGRHAPHLVDVEDVRVDAVEPHDVGAAGEVVELIDRMGEHQTGRAGRT